MKTVRRVGVGSVFKVAAVIYGLLFAIFGCVFLVLPGILGSGMMGSLAEESGLFLLGGGIVGTLVLYVIGIVVYALLSGIMLAIAAVIYNPAAGWVGGIEVQVD